MLARRMCDTSTEGTFKGSEGIPVPSLLPLFLYSDICVVLQQVCLRATDATEYSFSPRFLLSLLQCFIAINIHEVFLKGLEKVSEKQAYSQHIIQG